MDTLGEEREREEVERRRYDTRAEDEGGGGKDCGLFTAFAAIGEDQTVETRERETSETLKEF